MILYLLSGITSIDGADALLSCKNINYTLMTVSDEMAVYKDLSARLIDLEKAMNMEVDVLQDI